MTVIGGLFDACGNIMNHNMNVLLKKLTVINVVFLPLGVIAGTAGISEFTVMMDQYKLDLQAGCAALTIGFVLLGVVLWLRIRLWVDGPAVRKAHAERAAGQTRVHASPTMPAPAMATAGTASVAVSSAVVALLLVVSAESLGGQQYITDDAAITERNGCQIQMWHGQRASWVLPVCTPARNAEISVGFIAVWEDGADGHFEYVVQGKTLFRPLTKNGWGAGFVVGAGRDPALASTDPELRSYYAYVPFSVSLASDRVVLHQNTGWLYQRSGDERRFRGRHALTWAARADVEVGQLRMPGLTDGARVPLLVIMETYGAQGAAGARPEFQIGLRSFIRPETVQVDVSWGGLLNSGRRAAGWTIGLMIVIPPFL